ncbi:hypothetical protein FRC00_002604 [Tulasnella sp. 408]|nr:hypothetical protein FRC00_002604 [Tulasnella sp. 408]
MSLQIRASSTLKNALKTSSQTWSRTAWLSTTTTNAGSVNSEAENSSSASPASRSTAPPLPYTVKRSSTSTAYCVYNDYRAQAGQLTLIKASGDLHVRFPKFSSSPSLAPPFGRRFPPPDADF